jgi:hypothetical protein
MPMLGTEKVARQEDGNDGGKSRVGKDVLETIGAALAVDWGGGSSVRGSTARTGRLHLVARVVGTRAEIDYWRRLPEMAVGARLSVSLPEVPMGQGLLFLSVVRIGKVVRTWIVPLVTNKRVLFIFKVFLTEGGALGKGVLELGGIGGIGRVAHGDACWTNIVSTLLLLGIHSLNILSISHSSKH